MAKIVGWILCIWGILRFLSIDALIAGIQGADIIGNSESTIGTLWLIVDMTILDKAIGIVSAICGLLSGEGKILLIGIILTVLSFTPVSDYIMMIMYSIGSIFAG